MGRSERNLDYLCTLHNFSAKSLSILTIDIYPEMWYNVDVKESEVMIMKEFLMRVRWVKIMGLRAFSKKYLKFYR